MECPVCGNKKISPFATHCLECGADILAFPLLDDLEEQCVVTLKEKVSLEGELTTISQLRKNDRKGYQSKMNKMYWFLFLLPLLFFWWGKAPVNDKMEIDKLQAKNDSLENNITFLETQIDSLSKIPIEKSSEKVFHVVREGETLSGLAKEYFGSIYAVETLKELNPEILDLDVLKVGETIVIKLR